MTQLSCAVGSFQGNCTVNIAYFTKLCSITEYSSIHFQEHAV